MNIKEAIRVLNEDLKLAKEEDSIDIDVLTGNLEIALNLIEKQKAELEKKDRIIDKMAERLTTDIHSKEWVIDYYERKVEKR